MILESFDMNRMMMGLGLWSLAIFGIVASVMFLDRMFCKQSAAFRHALWLAAAMCIVAAPIAYIWMPGILPRNARSAVPRSSQFELTLSGDLNPDRPMEGTSSDLGSTDNLEGIASLEKVDLREQSITGPIQATIPNSLRSKRTSFELFVYSLLIVWVTGVILFLIRYWVAHFQLSSEFRRSNAVDCASLVRLVKRVAEEEGISLQEARGHQNRSIFKSVALTISRRETGPLVWGVGPAQLMLPVSLSHLSMEAQEAAIRHELAHVLRGDEWIRRFLLLLRTVFWFHPAVKHCCNQVQLYAELASDDHVIRQGCDPVCYSRLLLSLSRPSSSTYEAWSLSGMAHSQIENRIVALLKPHASRSSLSRIKLVCIAMVMVMATAMASAIKPSNINSNDRETMTQTPNEGPNLNVRLQDWPQWGGSSSRNNTPSGEKTPVDWDVSSGKNVLWSAKLGSNAFGGTVVANGKVFVGTNNDAAYVARFPKEIDLGVLLCFDEVDGKFLWQNSNRKLPTGRVHDWPQIGICSAPLIDGDRLWYVTNRGEVVCLDTEGFRDGENDGPFLEEESKEKEEADIVWAFDMMKELNVHQHNLANCSVTCAGDLLFLNTSHGHDETHNHLPNAAAPSFLCMSRSTGKVLWTDSSPNPNILHGQWSSPAYGVFNGVPQVIFGGGDGYLYGFAAEGEKGKGKLLWKFDCNPKESIYLLGGRATRNHIIATPVVYKDYVYVAVGEDPEHGEGNGHLWCVDPTKRGDVSPTLVYNDQSGNDPIPHRRLQALDKKKGDFERPNPNSAEVWHYVGSNPLSFETTMHRTCGTVAIQNNLLFVADFSGVFHCLDSRTGKAHWTYDLLSACWSSPLIVEGRVYIGDEEGDIAIFELSPTMKRLNEVNLGSAVYSTPIVANNKLFIASKDRLYVLQEKAQGKKKP